VHRGQRRKVSIVKIHFLYRLNLGRDLVKTVIETKIEILTELSESPDRNHGRYHGADYD
jgi:hypothetical protein